MWLPQKISIRAGNIDKSLPARDRSPGPAIYDLAIPFPCMVLNSLCRLQSCVHIPLSGVGYRRPWLLPARRVHSSFDDWIQSNPLPGVEHPEIITSPIGEKVMTVLRLAKIPSDALIPIAQIRCAFMLLQESFQGPRTEFEWSATAVVTQHCIDQFSGDSWLPTRNGFQASNSQGTMLIAKNRASNGFMHEF